MTDSHSPAICLIKEWQTLSQPLVEFLTSSLANHSTLNNDTQNVNNMNIMKNLDGKLQQQN